MIWIVVHICDEYLVFVEAFSDLEAARIFVLKQVRENWPSGFEYYPPREERGASPSVEQWVVGGGADYCIYPRSVR